MSFLDESTVFLAENSDAYVMKLEGNSFEEPIFVKRFVSSKSYVVLIIHINHTYVVFVCATIIIIILHYKV